MDYRLTLNFSTTVDVPLSFNGPHFVLRPHNHDHSEFTTEVTIVDAILALAFEFDHIAWTSCMNKMENNLDKL